MTSRLAAIARSVRRLRAHGWGINSIASAYAVDADVVRRILEGPPPRPFVLVRKPAPTRWRDQWRSDDWRFKDDVGLVEHPCDLRLEGIESNAPAPAIAPEVIKPAPSTWSGPDSPCQTSLPGGRRRIKD